MKRSEKKLGEILIEKGVIRGAELEDALKEQKLTKEFLGAIVVRKGYVSEASFLKALSEQFGIPLLSMKDAYINWDLAKEFRPSVILENKCFPVRKDDWSLTIAIINPLDAWALKNAEMETRGLKPKFVLVSPPDMEDVIQRYKQFMRSTASGMLE
ncbi:MAG: hypothetical protein WC515_08355 [Candidatus Omnitrophota bacterium]